MCNGSPRHVSFLFVYAKPKQLSVATRSAIQRESARKNNPLQCRLTGICTAPVLKVRQILFHTLSGWFLKARETAQSTWAMLQRRFAHVTGEIPPMLHQRFGDVGTMRRRGFLPPFPQTLHKTSGIENPFRSYTADMAFFRARYSLKRVAQPLDL